MYLCVVNMWESCWCICGVFWGCGWCSYWLNVVLGLGVIDKNVSILEWGLGVCGLFLGVVAVVCFLVCWADWQHGFTMCLIQHFCYC